MCVASAKLSRFYSTYHSAESQTVSYNLCANNKDSANDALNVVDILVRLTLAGPAAFYGLDRRYLYTTNTRKLIALILQICIDVGLSLSKCFK